MSIKDVRLSRGMSQAVLAERAEINYRTLQNYEQGERDINGAKLETLLAISVALECDIMDILTDDVLKTKLKHYEMLKNDVAKP